MAFPVRREHARARRVHGQNLLADPAAVAQVVAAARPRAGDLLYEVGAGRGRLTAELLRRGPHVVAYETDPGLAASLPRHDRLTVRVDDFLAASPPRRPFQVAGNIPYGLTSAVVDWCLRAPSLRSATLLTQLEYARKRTGDYGRWTRLTVTTWPWFAWRFAGRVPRAAFRPVPRVDGGILRLERRPVPLIGDDRLPAWHAMVDCGFQGNGGSLRASLSRPYGTRAVGAALRAVRLEPHTTVGEVWPEQWISLFRLLERR
nr:ErmE/ErmH/ErmO/ErmR family 23S rRNA (adenine(2058)-N(6))-methyltransferase [uncultured Actinoplanes sp.]